MDDSRMRSRVPEDAVYGEETCNKGENESPHLEYQSIRRADFTCH